LCDLEHKRLISIHARGIAVNLPVRDRPKCPTLRGCDQVLCHFDCPLTGPCLNTGSSRRSAHSYVIAEKRLVMDPIWRPACDHLLGRAS
jgi:hypothetical protein